VSNPLETYLKELSEIRSSGAAVKETSYYGPLATLLNEIGKTLKPKVKCIINLQDQGAGLPDGGLFTRDQFQKAGDHEPMAGQIPARGVIEVKSTGDDAWGTADGEQVTRYWGKYRLVLVTNYRDFVLVGQDREGRPMKLETYRLAPDEAAFWDAARHYRRTAREHGERLIEYLKRVMLHAAPLTSPEDVAWFLASYARDAKARIEGKDLPALAGLREALEEALGLTPQQALEHLGETTCDIYLNEVAYWRNVPAKVWGYYIGGYQVIKKWLSYREKPLLGRPLTRDEAREVTNMSRRLAAIVLMEPILNANYLEIKSSAYPWDIDAKR
jgi:hypothetical protein